MPSGGWRPPHFLREVTHFFQVYKELEGKHVRPVGWAPARIAKERFLHSIDLYRHQIAGLYE